jgi:hypothetical protein
MGAASTALVEFSEPLDSSAADASHFTIEPAATVKSAELRTDRRAVTLTFAGPLEVNRAYKFTIAGVADASPAHNKVKQVTIDVTAHGPVYTLDEVKAEQRGTAVRNIPGLPVRAHDPWTLNMFVRTEKQPPNHTIFAGFGKCGESSDGAGRYLCKFASGVHFWSHNRDVQDRTALDLSKWQMLTATYDGAVLRLYKDARKIAESPLELADDENVVNIMPKDPWDQRYQFTGEIRGLTIWGAALGEESLGALKNSTPK